MSDEDRGRPAGFDRKGGEVSGSGSGAGGGNPGEDYDQDPMAGSGADPPHGPRRHEEAAPGPADAGEAG